MTIRELVSATDYDVYIRSMWDTAAPKTETNTAVSNLLLGSSGIAELAVRKFVVEPEDLAIYALVDLPVVVMRAIYKYNNLWR